jgi:hypothetical protein
MVHELGAYHHIPFERQPMKYLVVPALEKGNEV